jgi:NitT/TauT family transport system permease protein
MARQDELSTEDRADARTDAPAIEAAGEAPVSSTTESQARARPRRSVLDRLELLIVPVILLVVWQLAAMILGGTAMTSPVAAFRAMIEGFTTGWLTPSLAVTLRISATAFLVAAVLGLWVGFLLGLGRFWGKVMEGPLLWVYSIPKVTLFPVFLLFLGLGDRSQIAFGAFHGFFPLVLFVLSGIRAMSPVYVKVGRVYGLGRWKMFTRVVVPDILPSMVTGLRYCFSLTFLGVILGEMFASREGAGHLLVQAIGLHRLDRIFAIALALVLVALAVNSLFLLVQRKVAAHRGQTEVISE